jgi:hypothetical protein
METPNAQMLPAARQKIARQRPPSAVSVCYRQRTRPHLSRQHHVQRMRPQRSRQQRRHPASTISPLRLLATHFESGTTCIAVALVAPDAARTNPNRTIATAAFSMAGFLPIGSAQDDSRPPNQVNHATNRATGFRPIGNPVPEIGSLCAVAQLHLAGDRRGKPRAGEDGAGEKRVPSHRRRPFPDARDFAHHAARATPRQLAQMRRRSRA